MSANLPQIHRLGAGARHSLASIYDGVAYFAVTPQSPYDASLTTAQQTRQCLDRLDERLQELGSDGGHLLFVTIMLADMADYGEFNEVWDAWVARHGSPPSRACIKAELSSAAMRVELLVHAAVLR